MVSKPVSAQGTFPSFHLLPISRNSSSLIWVLRETNKQTNKNQTSKQPLLCPFSRVSLSQTPLQSHCWVQLPRCPARCSGIPRMQHRHLFLCLSFLLPAFTWHVLIIYTQLNCLPHSMSSEASTEKHLTAQFTLESLTVYATVTTKRQIASATQPENASPLLLFIPLLFKKLFHGHFDVCKSQLI